MRFLSAWTKERIEERRRRRERERGERKEELLSTLKRPQRISSPSAPFLSPLPTSARSSDTQEVHFDIVRRLSTALTKSCRLHRARARYFFKKTRWYMHHSDLVRNARYFARCDRFMRRNSVSRTVPQMFPSRAINRSSSNFMGRPKSVLLIE